MAATRLWQVRTGTLQRQTYPDFYSKSMELYLKRSDETPIQLGQFFKEDTAKTLTFELTNWGDVYDMPVKSDDTDPRPKSSPSPGYNKTVTLATYRQSAEITKTLIKIDQSGGKAQSMLQGLSKLGPTWFEYAMSDVIETGTSVAGSDGSFLFADDHYQPDPGAGTWSNVETGGDLTSTTFETMRVSMANRKDEKGRVMGINLEKIKVAPLFEGKGRQISGSDLIPENANNAINPWKGVTIVVDKFQTDTDAWYGWGSLGEESWGLHKVVLTAPEVNGLALPSDAYPNIVAGFEIYFQAACAGSILRNMHRNAGA